MTTTNLDAAERDALHAARHLVDHGVPLFIARPALDESGVWDPTGGHNRCGYWLPPRWEATTPDPSVVDRWRPGDALCAVMGHAVDGADVDPRHGGENTVAQLEAAGCWPRSYGRQATPSGGWHDLVMPLGVASRDGVMDGLDIKAGTDGAGHGFLFLAPTVKLSKSTGEVGAYRWTVPPNLDELDEFDDTGTVLAARIVAMRAPDGPSTPDVPHDGYDAMGPAQQVAVGRYLARTVERIRAELVEVATWPEGHRQISVITRTDGTTAESARGWQKVTADVCNRLGQLARADWTPWSYADAHAALIDVMPQAMAAAVGLENTWQAQRGRRSPARYPESLDAEQWVAQLAGAPASPSVASEPPAEEEILPPVLDVVRADEVRLRRVVYHWAGRMPMGAVTLMPGEEGIGKTTVGIRIMADTTRGLLEGEHQGTPRDVVVLATEDGLEDVVVPRLREAGADLSRVHIVRARYGLDGEPHEVIIPRDLTPLGSLVAQHNVALLWVDSLVTTLPDDLKTISYKDTAKVLRALGSWAEEHRIAVAAPWHLNKASGSDTAVRIMDSRAFRTAVRSMLLVVTDPDAPEGETAGIVALDKANAGTLNVPGLRYRIRSAPYVVDEVDEDTGEVVQVPATCGVADWTGTVDGDARQVARDALAPHIEKVGGPREWLRNYLTDEGEANRAEVIKAAQEDGFSLDAIKRAARALGVHSRDESGRYETTGRPWRRSVWSLPAKSVHSPPSAPTAPTGEGSIAPNQSISAGQAKSVQSVQSGVSAPTGEHPHPLDDDRPRCPTCRQAMGRADTEAGQCIQCRRKAAANTTARSAS